MLLKHVIGERVVETYLDFLSAIIGIGETCGAWSS